MAASAAIDEYYGVNMLSLAKLFSKNAPNAPMSESNWKLTEGQINFFHAFGFLKIPKFFLPELDLIKTEFDRMMLAKFKNFDEPRSYLYPQIADNSEVLVSLLELEKLQALMSGLLGDDFLYKGSDGNLFQTSSTWHRDYLIRTKSCKMLIYLEPSDHRSGAFRAIPGTHFVDDAYSNFLGDALTWPEPPVLGGFDEKGMFGHGHSPIAFGQNQYLPQVVVNNEPGDVIIFNHNLIHCTNAMDKPKRRKLLGLHFCVNPKAKDYLEQPEEVRDEMRNLTIAEMETFQLPAAYGPCIMNSTSPKIEKMTRFFKDLRFRSEGEFNGLYPKKSPLHMFFVDRLKSGIHQSKKRLN